MSRKNPTAATVTSLDSPRPPVRGSEVLGESDLPPDASPGTDGRRAGTEGSINRSRCQVGNRYGRGMAQERITVMGDRVYRPAGWWTTNGACAAEASTRRGFHPEYRSPLACSTVKRFSTSCREIQVDLVGSGWCPRLACAHWPGCSANTIRRSRASSLRPTPAGRWRMGLPGRARSSVHGDFGPWNVVWDGLVPVGLVDFDLAKPGRPARRCGVRPGVRGAILRRRGCDAVARFRRVAGPRRPASRSSPRSTGWPPSTASSRR